ncbi:hypothetical protein P7K49_000991 [Saguinus oedipus]|uniref:Uncharacterized protein n=1 Tax=Saguinus oedipus TaxID=9490 RepID=A0ABQ9WDP4_SAGOE|nr:hypothetical protein P7K49_000991 [Saguinus oedipus]
MSPAGQTQTRPPLPASQYRDRKQPGNWTGKSECRQQKRRTSPHPDPTGNGGPRNGDYVLQGGAERRPPLPHPPRGPEVSSPASSPHRPRQSHQGSRDRSIPPLQLRPWAERPKVRRGPHKESGGAAFSPPPTFFPPRTHPKGTCLANPRSLYDHNAGLRIHAQGNGGGGGGDTGQRSQSEKRPTTTPAPRTPPSKRKTGLRPSPPQVVPLTWLLSTRGRRHSAAPPQPVGARQKTSAGSPPPPSRVLPAVAPDWLLELQRWREGQAIGPRPRQSRQRRRRQPRPPPAPPFGL